MAPKNAFYAQSGGVSTVINASACGVLETARQHSGNIGKVYAGRNGVLGTRVPIILTSRADSLQTQLASCAVAVLAAAAHRAQQASLAKSAV
jgi:hypothetical protein